MAGALSFKGPQNLEKQPIFLGKKLLYEKKLKKNRTCYRSCSFTSFISLNLIQGSHCPLKAHERMSFKSKPVIVPESYLKLSIKKKFEHIISILCSKH
jgi:hypothetical protein